VVELEDGGLGPGAWTKWARGYIWGMFDGMYGMWGRA